MIFCANCLQEMTCSKTGKGVLYGTNHYYPGDEYTCPDCGARVIKTNPEPVVHTPGGEEGIHYVRGD